MLSFPVFANVQQRSPFLVSVALALASLPALELQTALAQTSAGTPTSTATSKQSTDKPNMSPAEPQESTLAEARSFLQQGKLNDADRAVRQYLAKHPDSAEAHFLLGHILFREIQAEARLERLPEPQDPRPTGDVKAAQVDSSSGVKVREEQAKASLAEFTAGAKYQDPTAADLKVVAFDYVLLGDYVDADKWLTRMLTWTPNDSDGWYHLGRTKYSENRFTEAVTAFEECLKLDPKNVKAEDNVGLTLAGLGRYDEAAAKYQQAIAWEADAPNKDPGPYVDWGSLLLDSNQPESALPLFLQAVKIAPRKSKPHELLGKAYSQLGELANAQEHLEIAVSLSPQSAPLHFMLGQVYRKRGLIDKAKSELEICAALNATHSTSHTTGP